MSKFIEEDPPAPCAFIQWKGTEVCMDFYCECGTQHHIDAMFVYGVKCHECGAIYEMPAFVIPRKVEKFDGCLHVTQPDEIEE
jgi:hypothetical protein